MAAHSGVLRSVCNTTCSAYPTTDVEKGEALCSQKQASYQRNVMVFGKSHFNTPFLMALAQTAFARQTTTRNA